MSVEGRTGESKRAVRLKMLSDPTPHRGEREGILGRSDLDFSAVLREFYKAFRCPRSKVVRGVPQLQGTCLP